jgi:hypothetical protein
LSQNQIPDHVAAKARAAVAEAHAKPADMAARNAERAEQTSRNFDTSRTADHVRNTLSQNQENLAKTPGKG